MDNLGSYATGLCLKNSGVFVDEEGDYEDSESSDSVSRSAGGSGSIVGVLFGTLLIAVGFVAAQLTGISLGAGIDGSIAVGLFALMYVLVAVQVVNQWARRPVMRMGKYSRELGPGLCWINPFLEWTLDDVFVLDEVAEIVIKGVQTKDNVPLGFKLVLTTRVNEVRKAIVEVDDFPTAIEERAKAAANSTIRNHNLAEILGEGTSFSAQILNGLKDKIGVWGIEAKAVEVKDFRILDQEIEKAISMKARAQKEAEAELVRAELQKKIAEQLNAAADILDDEGWRFKALETLLELTRSANNNTILIPADLMSLARALTPSK